MLEYYIKVTLSVPNATYGWLVVGANVKVIFSLVHARLYATTGESTKKFMSLSPHD
jgi:hypothetical protein